MDLGKTLNKAEGTEAGLRFSEKKLEIGKNKNRGEGITAMEFKTTHPHERTGGEPGFGGDQTIRIIRQQS